MAQFAGSIRSGEAKGHTGKKLVNICAIGIGGSFLGPEFVYEALRHDPICKAASKGMNLKFLANVDPIDFFRATDGIDVEETLFIIISKTMTTAETMLNARTARQHILDHYNKPEEEGAILAKHLCAISTNIEAATAFGVKKENIFGFWDWVGGRFSVSSAVGLLPLYLFYGPEATQGFLDGLNKVHKHVATAPIGENIPMLLALVGWYNTYIAGYASRAILPYCQSLIRFPAHIQ